MNVYLIGYRATGKSTLARVLAQRLGWDWLDADVLVEQQAGCSIAEIFAQEGEASFRRWESRVIAQLAARDRTIVALGGGAVLREENRRALEGGVVIWLRADVETIHERVSRDPLSGQRRPNLTTSGGLEEIRDLLRQRSPLYRQTANLTLDTQRRSPEEIADEACRWLAGQGIVPQASS